MMIPQSQLDAEPGSAWCEENVIHAAAVRQARAALPSPSVTGQLADLFGTLADPTRVRLIAALAEGELCVCDLAATLGLSQSAVSHQLRLLRHLSLVRTRRAGRVIYYSLDDDHVLGLFRQGLDHVAHGRAGHVADERAHG